MTTTPRPIHDITADLREHAGRTYGHNLLALADELDAHAAEHVCVPKDRWPTADEIAELRARVDWLAEPLRYLAADIKAFLDKLDPPAPEPQADDDVDPWADLPDRIEALENTYDQRTSGHGYSERWDGYQQGLADAANLAGRARARELRGEAS